ncbi:AAA family ATPase [Leucobacter sp. CSA1]|uniref:AAA family ATPase n=1 Tax=Leucobacter chromiisoli TaxID=2796471 RepID=A0A934QB36_9MICO|nr:LuxR C-terminal-related transcriptional regulator [Leucobacter chromiisoli]MBK0419842.1 AAA family ATPase [Leucobacter chromiisoli]
MGREDDAATIVELLDRAPLSDGQLRLIQIDGAIGVGKSALLAAVLSRMKTRADARATEAGASGGASAPRLFLAQGDSFNADSPLTAHRALIEELLGDELERLLDEATPSVLAVRCAEALAGRPAIVAVDDAHWLGDASTRFLISLMQAPAAGPLTLILVHRVGQDPDRLIAAARRCGAMHDHLSLEALPAGAIRAIASGLSERQTEAVVEAAKGNPLFAHTATAAFRRHAGAEQVEEVLRLAEGSQTAVLSAAVADDMATLSEPSRRALETLAVLGGSSPVETVIEVADITPAEFDAATSELSERGLLSTSAHESLHPVIRYSVYQNTPADRRALAHRRAAQLEHAELFERAEHLAQLAPDVTADEAETLVRAAQLALGSDPSTVLHWLDRIPAEYRTLTSETVLARALIMGGRVEEAIERLRDLVAEPGGLRDAGTAEADARGQADACATEARVLLANALRVTGDTSEARALLASTADSIEPELLREYVDILSLLEGRAPDLLISRLETLPGDVNRMVAATYRTMDLLADGRVQQARVTFRPVPTWMSEADGRELGSVLHAVSCAAWASYILDQYDVGARLAERGLQLAHRFGQADVLSNLGAALSFCQASLGLLDAADETGEQAVADAERFGPPDAISMARAGLMIAAQGRADPALLARRFAELEATPPPEFGWWRRAVLTTRTRISALLGKPEPCPELLGEPRDAMAALRHADAAMVCAFLGQLETAASLIAEGIAIAEEQDSMGQRAMVQTVHAEILLQAGEPLGASNLLRAARDAFERLGMRLQLARATGNLARAEAMLARQAEPLARLTAREREVAELIATGLRNGEIAERLTLSKRTAENHVRRVMMKLGVRVRQEVADLVNRAATGEA